VLLTFSLIILSGLALFFWGFQAIFGLLNLKIREKTVKSPSLEKIENISFIISFLNEDEITLNKCVNSILSQKGINPTIFLVDDGSEKEVKPDLSSGKVVFKRLPKNMGKRFAHVSVINEVKDEWIVLVDSDTELESDSVVNLLEAAKAYGAGAVGGNILLSNGDVNFLTRMTACMYWFALSQERAAQSYWGSVFCCSGALSLYKTKIIRDNAEKYTNQVVAGVHCKSGDDTHLSSLASLDGEKVCWYSKAIARTSTPETWKKFLKQQFRWSRSRGREVIWLSERIHKLSIVKALLLLQYTSRNIAFAAAWIAAVIHSANTTSIHPILMMALVSIVIATIKTAVAICYTREWRFILLIPYSLAAMFVIGFCTFVGACMVSKGDGWMTRKSTY
jgi:hyaluronan synthase